MINIKDLGLKGDGQPDSTATAKLQAAIAAMPAAGEALYFPAGKYLFSSPIVITGKSVVLMGDGREATILVWTTDSDGIVYSGTGSSAATLTTFAIQAMTLATRVAAAHGTALTLTWPDTPFNPLAKSRIREIEIRGEDFDPTTAHAYPPPSWWRSGIAIGNSGGLDLSHVTILGNAFGSDVAIRCETVGSSVYRHFVSDLFIRWFDVGMDWVGPIEGVYMTNFELVACRIGFRAIAKLPGTGGTVWHIANGHMDCREVCAQFTNHTIIKLSCIAFFHTGAKPPRLPANMLQFDHCQWISVSSCSLLGFFGAKDFTPIVAQNGIAATNCSEVLLTGNHLDLIGNYAMICGARTSRAHSVGNRAFANGGRWLNQGDPMNADDNTGE